MPVTLDSPIDSVTLADVGGHVDALGLLTLTDASGQPRDDLTVAIQDDYDSENPEPLRLEAADLDPLAGSLVVDYIEATTVPQWTALAATGEQPHTGRWRVFALVEVGSSVAAISDAQARLIYRSGDGPFSQTGKPVVTPHVHGRLIELDLGIVNLGEVEGDHSWYGQVEFRGDTAGTAFRLKELLLVPAVRYARLRAPRQLETITGSVAYDTFEQAAGALDGVVAPLGGTWDRVAGDTDDFTISDTLGVVQRSTINDSAIGTGPIGILQRLGTATATLTVAQVDVTLPWNLPSGSVAGGPFIRYVDADNWLVAARGHDSLGNAIVYLMKVIAGTSEVISYARVPELAPSSWRTVGVAADVDGNVALFEGARSSSLSKLAWVGGVAADADLATGGVLDDGGYGLHDASSVTSGAPLRQYVNFIVSDAATVDHVIFPNQSMQLDHRSAQREDADGTSWGAVPSFTGRRLFVPPATRNGNVSRLVVKQDRNDLTQLPVATIEYRALILADSPALYWPLQEESGATADDAVGSNDGTYVNTPTLGAAGPIASESSLAVELDGTTEYISSSYSPFAAGSVRTFEGWAYRDTSTTDDTIFGASAAATPPRLHIALNSNTVSFRADQSNLTTATWTNAWPGTAQWVHWALIFNESADTAELYINGVSKGSVAHAVPYTTPGTFQIGMRVTNGNPFDGRFAHVAVYDRALTGAEILRHYEAGVATGPTPVDVALSATLTVTPRVLLTS